MFNVRQPEGVLEEEYDHVPMDGYFQDNSDYAWYLIDWHNSIITGVILGISIINPII
jgi:hypothetical protein